MQNLDGSEDLRVWRTRKLLQQALIEGTEEKGFAAITVRDITRRAMVNRSTFYRHYLDKYDLLEQHIHGIYEALEEGGGIVGEGRLVVLTEILKQVQHHPGFYRVMLSSQAEPFLSPQFRQQTQARYLAYLRQTFPETANTAGNTPPDLKFTSAALAGCGALGWWLEQEPPFSPEQFALWMQQMLYDMLLPAAKQKE